MTDNVNAEIISIGTEILLGEITDTNSVFLARALRDIGVNVFYMTSVGDNRQRIADSIRLALSRADIVITCGGLGPTIDDMTRQGVADATERELEFQQALLDQISARFNGFRVQMTENNRRQAFVPTGAYVIDNPVGTAPCFLVETTQAGREKPGIVISLPGVPREMKYLMNDRIIPLLRQRYDLGIIKARILKTAGIGESTLDDLIGTELLEASNPTVGLAAHNGQVDVRITAKADTLEVVNEMIMRFEQLLMSRISHYVYGYDDDRLEDILMNTLKQRGATIAIWEAGLHGAVNMALPNSAELSSASNTFAHPNDLKQLLEVNEDVTNKEFALIASQRLQQQSGADITITIISLPDIDESVDSAETTVVVVAKDDKVRQRSYGFGGKSDLARQWVTTWSLASAWWLLRDSETE